MPRARSSDCATARGLVHWLESRWQVALGSVAGVVIITVAFLVWGVPAIANWAAGVMPASMDRAIGAGSLEVLDRVAFEKSNLPKARQRELKAMFTHMTAPLDDGHDYELELRDGGGLGANAFALPSGIVVMTDQLVELSKSDDELRAVLAHEIGHVRGTACPAPPAAGRGHHCDSHGAAGRRELDLRHPERRARAARREELPRLRIRGRRLRAAMAEGKSRRGIEFRRHPLPAVAPGRHEAGKKDFDFFSTHPATGKRASCKAPAPAPEPAPVS